MPKAQKPSTDTVKEILRTDTKASTEEINTTLTARGFDPVAAGEVSRLRRAVILEGGASEEFRSLYDATHVVRDELKMLRAETERLERIYDDYKVRLEVLQAEIKERNERRLAEMKGK